MSSTSLANLSHTGTLYSYFYIALVYHLPFHLWLFLVSLADGTSVFRIGWDGPYRLFNEPLRCLCPYPLLLLLARGFPCLVFAGVRQRSIPQRRGGFSCPGRLTGAALCGRAREAGAWAASGSAGVGWSTAVGTDGWAVCGLGIGAAGGGCAPLPEGKHCPACATAGFSSPALSPALSHTCPIGSSSAARQHKEEYAAPVLPLLLLCSGTNEPPMALSSDGRATRKRKHGACHFGYP